MRSRADGATYDGMWRSAVRAAADVVTITSYNEWHEGTQIEPARAVGPPYASYDGAYGLVGRAAQRAYLDRTAVWVARATAALVGPRSRSVERGREPAAVGADERVVGVEPLEQRDRDLAQPLALVGRGRRHRVDDQP